MTEIKHPNGAIMIYTQAYLTTLTMQKLRRLLKLAAAGDNDPVEIMTGLFETLEWEKSEITRELDEKLCDKTGVTRRKRDLEKIEKFRQIIEDWGCEQCR